MHSERERGAEYASVCHLTDLKQLSPSLIIPRAYFLSLSLFKVPEIENWKLLSMILFVQFSFLPVSSSREVGTVEVDEIRQVPCVLDLCCICFFDYQTIVRCTVYLSSMVDQLQC